MPGEFLRPSHVSGVLLRAASHRHLHRKIKDSKIVGGKKMKWLFFLVDCKKQCVPIPQSQSKTCFPSGPGNQSSPDREILDSLGLCLKYYSADWKWQSHNLGRREGPASARVLAGQMGCRQIHFTAVCTSFTPMTDLCRLLNRIV